jgi:hypothetical protein
MTGVRDYSTGERWHATRLGRGNSVNLTKVQSPHFIIVVLFDTQVTLTHAGKPMTVTR